jgi:transcriptional regulator with XRE-family HTH domain
MNGETVAARVAALRTARNVSVDDLATRAGLEPGFVRDLENDEAHPSLATLMRVARGLGVRLGTFIDDKVSTDPYVVRSAQGREELTTNRGKNTPTSLRFHSLGKGKTDRHMEPFLVEILPESENDDAESSHEGEEFLMVLNGVVELRYGGVPHRLDPGDSIYYNSVVPHRILSIGGPALVCAVLYLPA